MHASKNVILFEGGNTFDIKTKHVDEYVLRWIKDDDKDEEILSLTMMKPM